MQTIQQQVLERLDALTLEQQQQVLDFAEFLQLQAHTKKAPKRIWAMGVSALEAAGNVVGCVEGPADLSTNKQHMQGFGEL